MTYPPALIPTTVEALDLPSGRHVSLPKAALTLRAWSGARPQDDYGRKRIVDIDGRPGFAELAALSLLQRAGWNAAWIDTFRGRRLIGFCDDLREVDIPPEPQALLNRLPSLDASTSSAGDHMEFCSLSASTVATTAFATHRGSGSIKHWTKGCRPTPS
jgi:hypothetical protein